MATIRRRKDKNGNFLPSQWQALIEKKNRSTGEVYKEAQTFQTKDEAMSWARGIEASLDSGKHRGTKNEASTPLRNLILRYRDEVTPLKKGKKQETTRLNKWLEHKLANRMLTLIEPSDFAQHITDRRKDNKAEQTIKAEIIAISNVFKIARADWGYKIDNPIKEISKPGGSKKRSQRLLPEAWTLISAELRLSRNPYYLTISELAIETAMRQGELFKLRWSDINLPERYLTVREGKDTTGKNTDDRIVPLSKHATRLIDAMPRPKIDTELVFQVDHTTSADGLSRAFTKACKAIGLSARFHDTRHEACSRMAPHMGMHELMKITGHETASQLIRYYNPTASELTPKLDKMPDYYL